MSHRFVQAVMLGLTLAGSAALCRGATPASIGAGFNGTSIHQGNYIWFNSVVRVGGQGSNSAILTFNSSTITFSLNGTPVTLNVPAAVITFSAGATSATTAFNTNTNTWITSVPIGYSGNVFLTGLAYPVPANFPSGLSPVTWSGAFFGGTSGLNAQWQWAAAVYQDFSSNMSYLGVKPVASSSLSSYSDSDPAGTPESYTYSIHGGGTGNGGSNYTGTYSSSGSPVINPGLAPTFTSSGAAQTVVVGQSFSFAVTATNGTSYSALSLPPGLTISSSGVISGTPTTIGSYSAAVTATNGNSGASTSQTLAFSVYALPAFTSANPAQSLVTGQSYSFTATATNSATFTASSLPTGLSISSTGLISGTPTAVGNWATTITATNSGGSTTQTLAFTVTQSGAGSGSDTVLSRTVFSCTGSAASYTAPAGTDYVIIKAWGAGGACGSNGIGGDGSYVQSSFNCSSGQQCTVQVGAGGSSSSSGGWPDGRSAGGGGCGGGGGSTQVTCSGGSVSAAGGCGGDNQGRNGTPGGCGNQGNQGNYFQWQNNNCSGGCGGGWATAQGSCFNSSIQCGGNGNPPNAHDPDYPGNSTACGGGCGGHSNGCSGGCVIIACHRGSIAPVITSGPTASGVMGQSFNYPITATGGATSYGASGLPSGLSCNSTTGVISGLPAVIGTYSATLTATNSGASATAPLSITVTAPVYTLTITASPAGAGTFSGAGTYTSGTSAAIQETPAAGYAAAGWSGTNVGSVAAPGAASTSILMSANRTIVANFSPLAPVFSGVTAQVLVVGRSCTYQVTATQSPTFSATALPPGLSISSGGLISGTPTTAGQFTGTVVANNNGATASCTVPFTVYPQPVITSSLTSTEPDGQPWTYTITASGNPNSFSAAGLPGGLTVNPATGVISGTPTQAGNYAVTLAASNPGATGTAVLALTVNPVVTSTLTDTGKQNEPFTYSIGGTGATTYSASGLPAGLAVNTTTGVISGIPTVIGTFNVPIVVMGYGAAGSATLILTITPTFALTITGSAAAGTFTGEGIYDPGTVVTVTETPSTGYRAGGWGGPDGTHTAAPASASTTIVMSANRSLVADFVQQAVLTVTAGTGGNATGSGTYDVGTAVPITATPLGSYAFTGWSGSGLGSATSASTTVTLTGNETVNASFTSTYTLSITGSAAAGSFSGAGTYPAGTVVTVTETPNTGYRTGGWGGPDGGSTAAPSSASTTIVMSANRNLVANFVQQAVLTVTAGTGGTAAGGGTYDVGSTVTITETPSAGYRPSGWTGPDGASTASPSSASTTIIMSANRSVVANFVQQEVLTITTGPGGTATGGGTYDIGTVVAITETPNANYRASGWTGPDGASTASPSSASTTIVMSANRNVVANFVHQAVLTVTAGTGGTATGGGTYDVGTTVAIAETPSAGYRTSGWGGPDGASTASPSSASTTIVMSANRNVVANFVQQAVLTVAAGAGGTATGGGTYDVGTTVPITATPTGTYVFSGWGGAGLGNASSASTTVTLTGNETVTANFIATYTLTISGSAAGGSFSGAGTYNAGTVVTVTETPNTGYRASGWGGPDAGSTASPSSASTTIVMSADRSLVADFVQQATLTVTAGTGGTASGSGTYDVGTVVPVTAAPTGSYAFNGWSGSSLGNAAAASTTVTLTGNETVTANFIATYTLSITGSAAGGSFSGAGTYNAGTVVTVAETPNTGYRASGWGGPDGASTASPSSASTTIVMSANRSLVADFVQQATLTVAAGTGGTATGGGTYDIGSTVTITATPAVNYNFSDWTGSNPPAAPTATTTTIDLTGNLTVTANFAEIQYPPTATITAAPTAYTGSPFTVTSTASAQDDNLTLHSVEWLSPTGAWTVSSTTASGGTDNRTVAINFPTTGAWTLRAGASVDNGVTWVYSPSVQVVVSSGLTTYVLESMAVPSSSMLNWYVPSPVVQKTYQVLHTNP